MALDVTELRALRYELLADFKLDDDAALYLLNKSGTETLAPRGSWYVEEDLETSEVVVRLFPVNGLTQEVITATVDVAYQKDPTLGFLRYGPMRRGEWKQASSREWKRVGSPIGPWTPPPTEVTPGYISGWPFWFTVLGEEAA